MKKHHIFLVLLVAGIAAFFLNEARVARNTEANVKAELEMLRDAVRKSPHPDEFSLLSKSSNPRPPVIDPLAFVTDLAAVLKSGPEGDIPELMEGLQERYQKQLASAPLSKLKEICELIEKDFSLGEEGANSVGNVWLYVVGMASKSDPAWAIAKLDQVVTAAKAPVGDLLRTLKRWASQDGQSMSLSYATAVQKWLDTAQAGGRIESNDSVVMELRVEVATAQGNPSTATQQISQLSFLDQQTAAKNHLKGLQTPEAWRQAIEELSTALHHQNFPRFVADLTNEQGVETTREILSSASLTPENHDLAAAGIASAKIGPDTKEAAAWLLESLRTDDPRALKTFAREWTQGDYAAAADWVNSIPKGPKRDAALMGFVPAAAKIDGATAMDWALTISDPYTRNIMYCEAHEKWKETDSVQANAYSKSKPLDREAVMAASKPQNAGK